MGAKFLSAVIFSVLTLKMDYGWPCDAAVAFEKIETPMSPQLINYQYTSIDVARVLSVLKNRSEFFTLDGSEILEYRIYRRENQYILPLITGHRAQSPYAQLAEYVDIFLNHTGTPKEIIIPFNPGGHWVTFRVRLPEGGNISIEYIDSLGSGSMLSPQSAPFIDTLKRYFPEKNLDTPLVSRPRLQTDGVSCGVIMVENILSLFEAPEFPKAQVMDREKILSIRHRHLKFLKENSWDLDK